MNRPTPTSDEQLAASALQGDGEAFTALYQNYFDQVYDLASRVLRDSAAAADVAQNVFMKFLGSAEVKPPQVSFRAWLYTMTRNAAIDELRRRRRVVPIAGKGINVVGDNSTIKKNKVGDSGNRGNASDGIQVNGNGASIQENEVSNNGGTGLGVTGDKAVIKKNKVGDSGNKGNAGDGLQVTGGGASIEENQVFNNGGIGISVAGDDTSVVNNKVGDKGNKGNGSDGINAAGGNNTIEENDVFGNAGDGIAISGGSPGSPNIVKKNEVGDKGGSGNGGNGILVSADGNGDASPVEIEENVVKASALAGIKVVGAAHGLMDNESGGSGAEDNGGCDYDLANGNLDQGGNQSDGFTVSLATPGCTGNG